MSNNTTENLKHVVDLVSFSTVLATLAAWLPPIAALVSIVWGVIRIYETTTVQKILAYRKSKPVAEDTPVKSSSESI